MNIFYLLKLELLQGLRRYNDLTTPLWFLILMSFIFSFGLQHDLTLLQKIAPSMIWVSVILAISLSIPQLFSLDYQSGILEQMILSPTPLPLIVSIKCLTFWLKTCLPILFFTPLLGLLFEMPSQEVTTLILSLLLATPSFVLLSALLAALTIGLSHHTLLLTLLILPLSIPLLICSLNLMMYASLGLSLAAPISLLLAFLLLSLCFMPFAISFSLRIGIHQ